MYLLRFYVFILAFTYEAFDSMNACFRRELLIIPINCFISSRGTHSVVLVSNLFY